MLTKAVVEQIIDKNTVKVRIPLINLSRSNINGTPTNELPTATICTLPQCYLNPQINDIVYVSFEDNDPGRPVILGYLQTQNLLDTKIDITLGDVNLQGTFNLPTNPSKELVKISSILDMYNAILDLYQYKETLESIISNMQLLS